MKMNLMLRTSTIIVAAALPLGFCATRALAVNNTTQPAQLQLAGGAAEPTPVKLREEDRRELRHVFWQLEHANADYDGHKAAAMEKIREAAELLSLDLRGEGYAAGHDEHQSESDRQVRAAREKLEDLATRAEGAERDLLREAARQLKRALEVH